MNGQNVGNSWMSITQGKPVLTRSKLIPTESTQIETSNWQDLLGIYGGLLQEEIPSNGVEQPNLSSPAAATKGVTSPVVVGDQDRPISHGSSICNSYQKNVYNISQEPIDGFPIPYWPFNNLHSPLRAESGQYSAASCFQLAPPSRIESGQYSAASCFQRAQPTRVESGQSSAPGCFQLAPVTPDQRNHLQNSQHCIQYSSTDQSSNWRSDQQKTLALSEQQNNLESSAGGITASPVENQSYLDGNQEGINLNRTPKEKTPKRRKHRPKVVRERKQKRNRTATTTINGEKQPKKRKYVRRKNTQESTPQTKNMAAEVKIPEVQSASKSCRRGINFDLIEAAEKINDRKTKEQQKGEVVNNLNSNYRNSDCRAVNNNDLASTMFKEKHQGYSTLEQHTATSTVISPSNQMLLGASSLLTSTAAACTANNHTLDVITRTLSMQNASHYQPILQNSSHYQPVLQNGYNILGEGIGRIVQTNSCYASTDTNPLLQSINLFNGNGVDNQRGSNREYYQTSGVLGHIELNPLNCSQWRNQMDNNTKYYVGSSNINIQYPDIAEKSKVSDAYYGNLSRLPAFTSSTAKETGVNHGIYTGSSTSQYMKRMPDSYLGKGNILKKPMKAANQIPRNHHVNQMAVGDNFLKQNTSQQVRRYDEQMDNKMSKWQTISSSQNALVSSSQNGLVPVGNWNVPFPLTEVPSLNALVNVANSDLTSPGRHARPTQRDEVEMSKIKLPEKGKTRRPRIPKKATKKERMLSDRQNLHSKFPGSRDEKGYLELFNDILDQLQGLQIYESRAPIRGDDRNALVPYIGNGSVVPYKEPIKRRKPRPKVNLDPETNRLWNLLMWNEGSESTENMDKDTEERWEEERKVFRGRIDSFIARMHLVQGDRTFSPWKGSVVDSVIGVFLTQNVSDHLSSSAFMSLAAKFPLLSLEDDHHRNMSNVIVEEPDLQVTDPGGAISYHARILAQPVFYQSSTTCSETSEQRTEDIMARSSSGKKTKITEEEVVSSQSSCTSIVYQAIEEVKSNSDSNSAIEDQTVEGNFHPDQNQEEHGFQHEINYMFQEHQINATASSLTLEGPKFWHLQEFATDDWQNPGRGCETHDYLSNFRMPHVQGFNPSSSLPYLQQQEVNLSEFSGEGGIYSFPQVQEEGDHYSKHIGQMTERLNAAPGQVTKMKKILAPNMTQRVPSFYHSDSISLSGPATDTSELAGILTQLTEGTQNDQSGQKGNPDKIKASANISNGRKRTIDRQIKKTFDWDSLRRQVQPLGSTKERSKNTMDSLNYEKLRNADVKEISETIKERGMNNMLAERMKDFLNRLVKEHGSIDLEWLRDVPPDKVKDYLLSIRGLGLKSVECVRLLTLHNVAFPVDTNVGRIAVRLGWVPLQPLPESLQLHLLEMYPVLESIQKYLWPRLCKLDQKTLYELHYQMITFGKVFCTKSRPNCNACPLRAECRHFASAFASARLALPGPEERSIVGSVPVAANDIPSMFIEPLLLPPADNPTEYRGPCNDEPTVEEPKTPEPSVGALESDIEDAFYDDTDEIPTINLNLEEFTTNFQTFMQEHMEMQGDISKAIVAVNPVTSYTTRQLKDVNRLRTEHYVYELPDSHPLLRTMDRREADDPSPYLLAIWSPGETADSVRPPESKCDNQASGSLCQQETCFTCNSIREADSKIVRGTILIPCRTAMRGSFPLNGTYFQVNEMFADHASSVEPIVVPRELIWNLSRRIVYFGTSVTSIFRGLTTAEIQLCFWRGFVCVRGFEQETRRPTPLVIRMHLPPSKQPKITNQQNRRT
ncbi:hypothetical protein Leryth_008687 [Lithospermum erythrorhizon]|nr:hypothetical protein Leryth_008687 [Lithospermum erythrorhizon]